MFYIAESEFRKLAARHPDYISRARLDHTFNGRTCKAGDWMGFQGTITGDYSKDGTVLIFEHIHFEIIKGQ